MASIYLQPKEDKLIFLPHSGSLMLNLQTTQIWTAVKRFKSGAEDDEEGLIGYALHLDGDTSPNAYLVAYSMILEHFNVISDGEVIPPINTRNALDAMVRDAAVAPTIL